MLSLACLKAAVVKLQSSEPLDTLLLALMHLPVEPLPNQGGD